MNCYFWIGSSSDLWLTNTCRWLPASCFRIVVVVTYGPPWFSSIPSIVYLQMGGNISSIQGPVNDMNSAWARINQVRGGRMGCGNVFVRQIWAQYHKWFLWKCTVTSRTIKGNGNVENSVYNDQMLIRQWEATGYLAHQIWAQIDAFYQNARKLLDISETRKWLEFSKAWPKVDRLWRES